MRARKKVEGKTMIEQPLKLPEVLALARGLSTLDRIRLIEELATTLEAEWRKVAPQPQRSVHGLWADLGPAPTLEEIDQARQEAWREFPREESR